MFYTWSARFSPYSSGFLRIDELAMVSVGIVGLYYLISIQNLMMKRHNIPVV